MAQSYKVAVNGGGTAGLCTARELQREGHRVTVFEKANRVGGTWLYDSQVESDLLGLDPNREIVHSSLYRSLRVNLPRQIMGFTDYPFVKKEGGDPRPFPGHKEVLRFLEDFARDSGLMELIRFEHEVVRVELVDEVNHEWVVDCRTRESTESNWESKEEMFEAVVICNGNHTEPRIAEFPDSGALIGCGPSAIDNLKEISPVSKQVHQAIRESDFQLILPGNHDNIWQHSMIECARKDGKVVFEDGSIVDADVIIHCAGYKFHFPFLRSNGIVTVDNRVGPLYKHVFPPSFTPWLSFVGLNYRLVLTRVLELQANWVVKVLSGNVNLPSREAMSCSVEELYSEMEKSGWPKHHIHCLGKDEVEYVSWLAARSDIRLPERWKEITSHSIVKRILVYGENFRDTCDVDKWIEGIYSSSE